MRRFFEETTGETIHKEILSTRMARCVTGAVGGEADKLQGD